VRLADGRLPRHESRPRARHRHFEEDRVLYEFDRINYERYDPEVYRDVPIAMQLIGRKGEDEAVIRMMEIAVEALNSSTAAEQ
jgi:hypothetical protein